MVGSRMMAENEETHPPAPSPALASGPARPWLASYPPDVDWSAPLEPGTLPEMLRGAVARFGDRPCLDFLGRRWTYAQIGDLVERAAEGFRRLGVQPGIRVGLCLPNSPFYVVCYFAVLRAGGVVVNFSPLQVAAELSAQARSSGTRIMVTLDLEPMLDRVLGLLGEDGPVRHVVACRFAGALPLFKGIGFRLARRTSLGTVPQDDPRVSGFDTLVEAPPLRDAPAIAPGDMAVLQYTGGTTGRPKGAILTHANLTANLEQVRRWFHGCREGEERVLAVLPFFHVFAMTVALNAGLAWGAEIVLLPRYDQAGFQAALRRKRPTLLPGVPTLFKAVLDAGTPRAMLSSVRFCISGGAPLPLEVKHDFEAASGCVLVEGYGLTEASPVCFCNPLVGENRAGSIGLPLPGVEAEIRALDDPSRALPPGERGELCVRGPNVMQGYWAEPEETARVLRPDGFLRTGDVGIMAPDGYVTLVDRIKDIILCSGFNVYPRMIEEALYTHPDVAAATVVGMPDPYRGESAAAFVQPRPGASLTVEDLNAFLAERLSPIERPRLIELREELPRTAVGKLSKTELRQELRERHPGGQA
ncbi:long-chain fatty acid--CoA ligase [Roseomonas gilardii subsp. gilardii]|uniref:long-chain-fatty-acid--CoA ligase n=1 Tax=Roseomonas gilardii TaxID=257708 RepID=UPI001FFBA9C4|nr:long-chain fatty acid--CoA ligase [Roseomonas gilardii]UPG73158.1 long-chain fatty acid--CoA ligase [Roseomonas gilardii subsp. gilardii]